MKGRLTLAALSVAAVLAAPAFSHHRATSAQGAEAPPHFVRPGTPLTNTALDGFSQVDQVDMLSPTLGYALATHAGAKGRYWYYLVRTTDLAKTWTVRSDLPIVNTDFPIFADFGAVDSDPSIDFISRDVGYVTAGNVPIFVTDDAGATWRKVETPGTSPTYGASGSTMSAVSTVCTKRPGSPTTTTCASVLSDYRLGATKPERTTTIPAAKALYAGDVALLAAAPGSTRVVNQNNDNLSAPTSLLITHDDGEHWRAMANPCSGLMIEQLLVAHDGQWLLSCFLDEGMSHGTAKLFRSTDQGATWSTVVDDTALRDVVGNLGGTPVYFFFSGDDRTLYGAFMNPAGGLAHSMDGGTHWTPDAALGYTGGSPGSVSSFGPTSALYQVFQGPMYVTRDSRTWRIVPELPAGPYRGMSICTSTSTDVSLRHVKYGGLAYTYADFTNNGATSCYLDGAPIVQPLGERAADVGPPSTSELVDSGGDFVVLKARGGVADVPLILNPTSSYHPRSVCSAQEADALLIDFGPPSAFRLPLGSRPFPACTKLQNLGLAAVRAGPGKP